MDVRTVGRTDGRTVGRAVGRTALFVYPNLLKSLSKSNVLLIKIVTRDENSADIKLV